MLLNIISQVTTSKYDGDKAKFLKKFEQLYQLEILRPSLDLIATKCKNKEANFIVEPLKHWDRCLGHCQTKSIFEKIGGIFSKKLTHEIVIKTIESDIIMHEIAHAVEKTSGIDLNADFRKVLGLDMKDRISSNLQIAPAVNSVMKNELKNYKITNIMEELFARFFEMLAMSYEVGGFSRYQFKYCDIKGYFENTILWVEKYFNPLITKKIDKDIKIYSDDFVKNLKPYQKVWADDIKQTNYNYNKDGNKIWASGTKTTSRWSQISDVIENSENKKIEDN